MQYLSIERLSTLVVCVLTLLTSPYLWAKSNATMDVSPGMYKIKSGSTLPIKGPVIEVYAQGASTHYSHVANTHKKQPVLVKYTATCSNKGKISGGSIVVTGNALVGSQGMHKEEVKAETSIDAGDGFSSESVWVHVPYTAMDHIDPAAHCNNHAKTLMLEKDKSLEEIVRRGFSMKIPDVMSAKGTNFCQAAGLGKGDVASSTTKNLGVFIHCMANADARSPKKPGKPKRAELPDPGKATTIFAGGTLSTEKSALQGECPIPMKFVGEIAVTGSGEIEYQLIGDSNHESPMKTMKFKTAGSKEYQWTRMIRQPKPGETLAPAGGGADPNKIEGWMQLKVLYKVKNKIAYTKKTWLSERQTFTVKCGKTPARFAPMERRQ